MIRFFEPTTIKVNILHVHTAIIITIKSCSLKLWQETCH